jgi:F420-dependent methylenetetrahydromethanopterin dehydrogenase
MPTRQQEFTMAATSFNIDQKTDQTLENLRRHYQVSSKAEVLRKAIALLNVARRNEHADGTIIIRQQHGRDLKVIVR